MNDMEDLVHQTFIKAHMDYIIKEWDRGQQYLNRLEEKGIAVLSPINNRDLNDPKQVLYDNVLMRIEHVMREQACILVDLYSTVFFDYDMNYCGSLKYINLGFNRWALSEHMTDQELTEELQYIPKIEEDRDDYLFDLFTTYLYLSKDEQSEAFPEFCRLFDRLCYCKSGIRTETIKFSRSKRLEELEETQDNIFFIIDDFVKEYS